MKKGELNKENMEAAYKVARHLKKHKTLSREDFLNLFYVSKGWKGYYNRKGEYVPPCKTYTLAQNYERFIAFLINHGVMTKIKVNNFTVFVATQKCVRAKEENWFKT